MDLLEKLDALHAQSVTPEEFKEVWGVDKDKEMQKIMDFVDRFDKAKAKRDKKGRKVQSIVMVEPLAPAASDWDTAALPAAAAKLVGGRAYDGGRRAAKAALAKIKRREELQRKYFGRKAAGSTSGIGAGKTLADVISQQLKKQRKVVKGLLIDSPLADIGFKGKMKGIKRRGPKGPGGVEGPKG